ncbi:MAG: hypothetical protein KUL88_09865 [Rhizobium sp.]|nr:hypothetical protein [Rhizobium sp.]
MFVFLIFGPSGFSQATGRCKCLPLRRTMPIENNHVNVIRRKRRLTASARFV